MLMTSVIDQAACRYGTIFKWNVMGLVSELHPIRMLSSVWGSEYIVVCQTVSALLRGAAC